MLTKLNTLTATSHWKVCCSPETNKFRTVLHTTSGSFCPLPLFRETGMEVLLMKTDNSEYELIGEKDGKLIVRVKHMGKQVTTITKAQGNIVFDFNHDQYNSDHRNERHQDKFFATSLEDPDINAIDTLADRYSMEITSVYGKDYLLDMLIKNEDNQLRQQLANQLPDALKTLTVKQRYAVLSYYCLKLRKRQIANNMGISNVMAGRHVKAGLAKLRQFYGIKSNRVGDN